MGVQILAVVIAVVWAFVATYLMLWVIDKVTPVRVSSSVEEMGLDERIHGEKAYFEDEMAEPPAPKEGSGRKGTPS